MYCKDIVIRNIQSGNGISEYRIHIPSHLFYTQKWLLYMLLLFSLVTFKEMINQWSWFKKRAPLVIISSKHCRDSEQMIYNVVKKLWKDMQVLSLCIYIYICIFPVFITFDASGMYLLCSYYINTMALLLHWFGNSLLDISFI